MATSLLVVTPSPSFGESIRRPLEETGAFRVHVVNSKASAIVRADEESCRLAFLDLDLGETWVEEVGQSLRTVIPNIKLFVLAGNETPPAFDAIRPWTLLRKPLQVPEILQTIGEPAEAVKNGAPNGGNHDPLWLSDVNKAAQHLTRLTLESSSQAALITRDNEVWAYAGQLAQDAAQEIAKVLSRNWDAAKGGDLLRFVRLEATKAEHMLYATQLAEGMLLAMVFDAETPFSTIRSQAGQLAASLEEGEAPEAPAAAEEEDIEAVAPPMSELEDDEEGMDMPPISEILKDIPVPDPRSALAAMRMQMPGAPVQQQPPVQPPQTITEEPVRAADEPRVSVTPPAPVAPAAPVPATPLDPGVTRPSIFAHESSVYIRMKDSGNKETPERETVRRETSSSDTTAPSNPHTPRPPVPVSSTDDTVVSQPVARPETPVRSPQPGELDETRPHESRVEIGASELSVGSIMLEPISAGVYHLSYACLLLPRFATHYLTGDMADKLSEWIPIICVAFGWRLEYLAVRPEYLQWVVNVPPATSPGYVMRVIRQQLSDKVFSAFPRLKRDNPSGDFWAPGYLIMGGAQPHPPQLVKDYIRQIRQRQGIEKPQSRNPRP